MGNYATKRITTISKTDMATSGRYIGSFLRDGGQAEK
jgi:hypothetical protein